MRSLLAMEFAKILRLASVRFAVVLLVLFPILWAYAPGIFKVYGFYLVSAYQVPALGLLSSMQFLLPLLVAITAAELLGMELSNGTLQTILLRPVSRSQWLLAKLIVVSVYPFAVLALFFIVSLLAGAPYGYGSFVGGTGLGQAGLLGQGTMAAGHALREVAGAYLVAAYSLVPVSLLGVLFTVLFMSAAGGALATLSVLIFMQLLIVFPGLEPYLLTTQLNAYAKPVANLGWVAALIALYCAAFAALAVVLFERKDF
ncbi:MAG: ABC transporter permease [Deinococcales bacterium]